MEAPAEREEWKASLDFTLGFPGRGLREEQHGNKDGLVLGPSLPAPPSSSASHSGLGGGGNGPLCSTSRIPLQRGGGLAAAPLPLPVLPNPEGFAKALETHTVGLTVRTGLTSQVASEMDMGAERRGGPHLFPPSPLLQCPQGLSHKRNETGRLHLEWNPGEH